MENLIEKINKNVNTGIDKLYQNTNEVPVVPNTQSNPITPEVKGQSIQVPIIDTPISTDSFQAKPTIKLPEKTIPIVPQDISLPKIDTALEQERNTIRKEKATQENAISKLLADIGVVQASEDTFATEAGADKALMEYNRFSSELENEQRSLENKKRDLSSRGLTQSQIQSESDALSRDSYQKQADIAILANSARGMFDTAMTIAKRKVESALMPLNAQLTAKKFVYENNKDLFSKAELSKLDGLIKADERNIKREEERLTKGEEMIINAIQSKAPQSIISKARETLSKGGDITEVVSLLGRYGMSPAEKLDLELKRMNINKLRSEITETDISKLTPEQSKLIASVDPVGYFSSVIKSNKIKGSASLESLLGVIGASKDLAEYGIENKGFKGAAPIRLTPGVFKGEQQLTVQGNINAINLKVQQWASGAALTEQQTAQVKKFTPDKNDTDKQIKTKLNNLTNFMMEQGKSSLATQGINIDIPKIDLFTEIETNTTEEQYADRVLNAQGASPFSTLNP